MLTVWSIMQLNLSYGIREAVQLQHQRRGTSLPHVLKDGVRASALLQGHSLDAENGCWAGGGDRL